VNITIFNKKYWRRRFTPQVLLSNGYYANGSSDKVVSLDVTPMGSDQLQALPEGERQFKHLSAYGTDELIPADESIGQKGDLLWYHGSWYECTAAQMWDHTMLNHTNYTLVEVPKDASYSADVLNPPTKDPNTNKPWS